MICANRPDALYIKIGVSIANDRFARIALRIASATKFGLCLRFSVCNSDFRGEIRIILLTISPESFLRGSAVTRERQRGGQKRGGAKPHEETPHRNQFPTPLTSVRFAPPYSISLSKSLRNSRNFPQVTSSETIFGGSRKWASDGPSSRGFAFRYVLPPPLALPRVKGP